MGPYNAPLPPAHIAVRAGPGAEADQIAAYLSEGARTRERIEEMLPEGWTWENKRVLDFGCSSGRVLRHFLAEADVAELMGCDIDPDAIAWLQGTMCPPLRCFVNGDRPPLALESESVDLIWATSVFTHIDEWSSWLLELHRVLVPGGRLIATFLGEGVWEAMLAQPYVADEVGMTTLRHWTGPGADVFHSEWWLREHWGRAFDVSKVTGPPRNADGSPQIAHGLVAADKRPGTVTTAELERIDPAEHREIAALRTSVRLHRGEAAEQAQGREVAEHRTFQGWRERLANEAKQRPALRPALAVYRRLRR